jgi:hypothetical protein
MILFATVRISSDDGKGVAIRFRLYDQAAGTISMVLGGSVFYAVETASVLYRIE